ncbi:MAG: hypothetical protein ACR2OU_02760, partial [Thermomicrobiales bacterium]
TWVTVSATRSILARADNRSGTNRPSTFAQPYNSPERRHSCECRRSGVIDHELLDDAGRFWQYLHKTE